MNLEGSLAPLDVTEPTAIRRSSRILNKQSASQELPSPSLENPTTTQLSVENEQISYAPPSQTVGKSPGLSPDVYNWFSSVHNSWMGHRGVRQNLEMLHQRGHMWPTMKADVSNFISMCPTCQKLEVRRIDIQTHPYTTSTYQPHECLNIDTLVLNQPDKHGNIAIIVVIDTLIRWLEMYPIPDYTAYSLKTISTFWTLWCA